LPLPLSTPKSDPIPITLSDGESAKWYYLLDENVSAIAEELVKAKKDTKALRCGISTSHGKGILIKLDDSLIDAIIKELTDKI